MTKLDELLVGVRTETQKIFNAGGRDALSGSMENPQEEAKAAALQKCIAEIEILGLIGKFVDEIFSDDGLVEVEVVAPPPEADRVDFFKCACGKEFPTQDALRKHIGAMKRYHRRGHSEAL